MRRIRAYLPAVAFGLVAGLLTIWGTYSLARWLNSPVANFTTKYPALPEDQEPVEGPY